MLEQIKAEIDKSTPSFSEYFQNYVCSMQDYIIQKEVDDAARCVQSLDALCKVESSINIIHNTLGG